MIVRDEEKFLPDALTAIRALRAAFARTCVYDTGSIDGTVSLAKEAGAKVKQGYWDDDFARAKNAAVSMAGTDWVLSVDADERVVGDPKLLAGAVCVALAKGYDSLIIEVDDVRSGEIVNTAPSVRLFRSSEAHFRNRIHEVVVRRDGTGHRAARLPREILHLRHVGYGPAAAMARKQVRNSRIGELEVSAAREQSEDSVRLAEALVNRGRSLSLSGDWAAGIPDWVEARALCASTPFHLYAGELLARAYVEVGRVSEAGSLLSVLRREGSDDHLVAWLTARAFSLSGRPELALDALRHVGAPVSALGERHAMGYVLETRMIAAAEVGEIELAIDDAVHLMASYGVYGYARLLFLMWGSRPPEQLARRLAAVDGRHLARIAEQFDDLGVVGSAVAAAVRDCDTGGFASLGRSGMRNDWEPGKKSVENS